MRRHPNYLAVLLIACCWLGAGPSLLALEAAAVCPHQRHHMAGMPYGPCYCSHMAHSFPAAPADANRAPPVPPVAVIVPEAPAPKAAAPVVRPSPAYPPDPPPPNAIA